MDGILMDPCNAATCWLDMTTSPSGEWNNLLFVLQKLTYKIIDIWKYF